MPLRKPAASTWGTCDPALDDARRPRPRRIPPRSPRGSAVTLFRGLASRAADPGEVKVEFRCAKCGRFWFDVIGTADGTADRAVNYAERTWDFASGSMRGHDSRKGFLSQRKHHATPQAVVFRGQGPRSGEKKIGPVTLPNYAYERVTIACHRKCGRRDKFVSTTVASRFREAVQHGRTSTTM